MNLNRDVGAERSPSHTGPRPTRRPTNPNVGGVVVADEPRATPAMAAETPRHRNIRLDPREELLVPPTSDAEHAATRAVRAHSARGGA